MDAKLSQPLPSTFAGDLAAEVKQVLPLVCGSWTRPLAAVIAETGIAPATARLLGHPKDLSLAIARCFDETGDQATVIGFPSQRPQPVLKYVDSTSDGTAVRELITVNDIAGIFTGSTFGSGLAGPLLDSLISELTANLNEHANGLNVFRSSKSVEDRIHNEHYRRYKRDFNEIEYRLYELTRLRNHL